MALTLKDVVANQVQQRMTGARRDAPESPNAAPSRRERFSLDAADRHAALDAQARSSIAKRDTAKPDAPKPDAPKPEASKPDNSNSDASKPDTSKPQDKSAADSPRSAAGSGEDRPNPSSASAKTAPARSAAPAQPEKVQADGSAATEADPPAAQDAATEQSVQSGQEEAAADPQASTETNAAATPMLAIFVAPPVPATKPSSPSSTTGLGADADPEVSGTAATGAGGVTAEAGKPVGAKAAKPGFDAVLAEVSAEGAGNASAASSLAAGSEPAAPAGASAAPSSPAAAKDTAAVQQQAPAAAPPPAVPIGAVPMTIGLRALGASNRFEIRLDPKELGRVDVSIDIDKDTGTVGARLVVDRPETLAMLQRDASSLQQALSQTGLDASAGISLSLRNSEGDGSRNGGGSDAEGRARGAGQNDRTGQQADAQPLPIDLVPLRALRGIGRVDIRI